MSTTLAHAELKSLRPFVEPIPPSGVESGMAYPSRSVMVPGVARDIEVKVASTAEEWEAAFRLVQKNYVESGYEPPSAKSVRFTPYHALPDTAVFVAKSAGAVVATFSLVADGKPLGLPLDSLYEEEVEGLRRRGRKLAEVTSLAATGLSQREFVQVFTTLIRVMKQYHVRQGGDTWVITVNPKHRAFYCKMLGYTSLGPCRAYAAVAGNPAEAYWVDGPLMQAAGSKMYDQVFHESLPDGVLDATPMPAELIRSLAARSSQVDVLDAEQILGYVKSHTTTRAW